MRLLRDTGPLAIQIAAAAIAAGVLLRPIQILGYTMLFLPAILALTVRRIIVGVPFAVRWAFFAVYALTLLTLRGSAPGLGGTAILIPLMALPALFASRIERPGR